jgi:hypothetical protein
MDPPLLDPDLAGRFSMRSLVKRFDAPIVLYCAIVLAVILSISAPASAITVDLANKCRQMALKAHPPKLPGTKAGTAQAERDFFRACISNNGAMPDSGTQKSTVPAAK